MSSRWVYPLAILAMSWNMSAVSAQAPPPLPPGPMPAPSLTTERSTPAAPITPALSTAPAATPATVTAVPAPPATPVVSATPEGGSGVTAPTAGGITVTTPPPITSGPPVIPPTPVVSGGTCGGGILGGCGGGILSTPIFHGGLLDSVLPAGNGCGCGGGNWIAGGGVYVIQPFFSTNPAFSTKRIVGTSLANRQYDIGQQVNVAPLAFIGYNFGNNFGIRARWFDFQGNGHNGTTLGTGESVLTPTGTFVAGSPGSTVSANSSLHLQVYDLEFTYLQGDPNWSLLYSAGVRYALTSQNYQLNVADSSTGALNTFNAYHNFGGIGPTLALEGRHQLGNTPFALYGSGRGSILFGAASQNSSANTPSADTDFTLVSGDSRQTIVLPVGEIELGAEWAQTYGRVHVFVQVGVVGQVWWGGGNASQALYLSTGPGNSSSQTNNFGFLGGVARAGIAF